MRYFMASFGKLQPETDVVVSFLLLLLLRSPRSKTTFGCCCQPHGGKRVDCRIRSLFDMFVVGSCQGSERLRLRFSSNLISQSVLFH